MSQTYSCSLLNETVKPSIQSTSSPRARAHQVDKLLLGHINDSEPSSSTLDRSNFQGTNDNASGVGVLLELADRLETDTNNTVKFILFGAEEVGLIGSEYYASNMSEDEVKNTIVMVNLDSLIVGDKMYFHAGRPVATDPTLGRSGIWRSILLKNSEFQPKRTLA